MAKRAPQRLTMNWTKVVESLTEQGEDAIRHAEALYKMVDAGGNTSADLQRLKTIERHKINANLCLALAAALSSGLEG